MQALHTAQAASSRATIHTSPTFQLHARVQSTSLGHHLLLTTFVPTARRPEEQVKFSATLSQQELLALREVIDAALVSATA